MNGVSVLILTLNEEANLAECIDSCGWSDDIIVFDSMSEDRTLEIANTKGVRLVQRRFDNYAAQRNAALTTVQYKNPWVLMVDADERVSPELAAEIATTIAGVGAEVALFRIRRKDFFLGKWLRRSSGYPSWFGRLVRLGHVRVEREVNEEYIGTVKSATSRHTCTTILSTGASPIGSNGTIGIRPWRPSPRCACTTIASWCGSYLPGTRSTGAAC